MKHEWMGGDNRAVAILRVSSHRQKDNTSHDTQEKEIRDYCAAQGLTLADIVPITESAKESEMRKQYRAAIERILAAQIRHVVFNVFDREARNATDNERNETLAMRGRIVLHYARERKVFYSGTADSDWFTRDISAATNKQFIRNLRSKVADAMRTKAEEGHYPGNHPPMGYMNEALTDSRGQKLKRGTHVIPDPKTAPLVMRIFELRAAGRSYQDIKNQVVADGLVPPERAGKFYKSHVEKILINPFYSGRFTWGGKVYDGKHELIVPRDVLIKVQGVKRGNRASIPMNDYNLFGYGWMTCADCGCQVVYELKKGRFHYYRCSNSRKAHPTLAGRYVSLDSIWEQMAACVDSITLTPSLAREIAKAINETESHSSAAMRGRVEAARAALLAQDKREDSAFDLLTRGTLDELAFQRQLKRIREDRTRLEQELAVAERAAALSVRESAESLIELVIDAKDRWLRRDPLKRKEFLNLIQSNRQLNGVSVEVEMKKPFLILSRMANSEDWRPRLVDLTTALAQLGGAISAESHPFSQGGV
jgi:site-specific DNA recombinase